MRDHEGEASRSSGPVRGRWAGVASAASARVAPAPIVTAPGAIVAITREAIAEAAAEK